LRGINIFDSVVLGKGPLGILTSYKLIKKGKKVLNIDSGIGLKFLQENMSLNSNIAWLDINQKPSLNKSASNYMWLGASMGWPSDYFENGLNSSKSLPITIDEISSSYDQVAKILELSNFDFKKNIPYDNNNPLPAKDFDYIFAKVTNNLYLKNLTSFLLKNDNYKFIDNLIAKKITLNDENTAIEAINYPDMKEKKIITKNVYMCLGAVENTRVLLNSRDNLDINLNYLGNNLSDHISIPFAKVQIKDMKNFKEFFESSEDSPSSKLWPRITYKNPDLQSFCYVDKFHTRKIKDNFFAKKLLKYEGNAFLNLFIEKKINEDSFIDIDPDNSKLLINFIISNEEFENIVEAFHKYLDYFSKNFPELKISKFNYSIKNLMDFNTTNHPTGTTRMSLKPSEGVVDKYGRLWNHRNIFIYGSSVFPMASYIHPTFMSMSLANFSLENT